MQQMLHTGKRVVSAAVAAATIAFAAGILGLVQPSTALGASAGDLIKGSLSTVYYYGYDGQRYTFPNEKTYMTWYADFSDVTTISDSALADITLAGNVVYRGGARWIKIQSDPRVYVVSTDGALHWLESESVATSYAGSDWASFIDDVPDGFWPDYTVGASAMTATAFDGQMWKEGSDYYIAVDGEKRMVSSAGRSANGLQARFFLDGTGIDDSALTAGDDITGAVASLMDPAQTVTGSGSATGDLTVTKSSSTAAAASLPGGANAVDTFSFNVKAGAEDATLDAVTLTMIGAGATTNINNVYLYNGSERLTEARSVNASTRQATFSNIGLSVDAGDTVTVTARVEVSSSQTAADTFGFEIASADDITASGDVNGSFPIAGNIFTFTGSDVGYVNVNDSGSITNPTLGEQDAVIGQFKISANNEAASIGSIMLKIDNASDHDDFWLWDGDVPLVEGTNTSGDFVLFDLSGEEFAIAEGSSNIFSVSADIGGQGSDTVKVFIDNEVDVTAVGGDFGFGMCVDIGDTSCGGSAGAYDGASCTSGSNPDCSFSTIQGGDITITSSGPNAGDVQVNSQDQVLLNFTITSEEEVTIKDLDIGVAADDDDDAVTTEGGVDAGVDNDGLINSGSEANLKDIKIIDTDTGAVVMGPLELDDVADDADNDDSLTTSEDGYQTIDFSDDWTLDAGETRNLAVVVDIDNGITAAETVAAVFDISGFVAEDGNGDAVTNIVPSGDITSNSQTARAAAMTVALASTPGDVTTVDGTDNVLVNAFSVTAGTASDLHVSSIKVSVYADEDNSGTFTAGDVSGADVNDFIESCYLTDGSGNKLGSSESPISTGLSFTVTDTDWDLNAGSTNTLKVYCSFANPSDGTDDNAFAFDIADLSEDMVVVDEDGNDVDPTTDAPNGGTSPTNSVYVQDAGSLAVTASASTPNADFVLTSSRDNHVASYTFTATNEAFEVHTLQFTEEEAEDDACGFDGLLTTQLAPTGCSDATGYANNISLVTISYPLEDGTMNEVSGAMSGNAVTFTLASDEHLYVPANEPVDVDVYVDVPLTARDAGGSATSNEEIRMAFSDADNSGTEAFKAYGVGSGTQVTEGSSGIADIGDDSFGLDGIATFVVRETKPTLSIASGSPSGAAVPGLSEVLRFNVAASSNESVVLDQVTFKITTTDNAGNGTPDWNECKIDGAAGSYIDNSEFSIYNLSESASTALDTSDTDWTLWDTTGAVCTTTAADLGFVTIEFPSAEIIGAGDVNTYSLKIDTTGASSNSDDAIRVDIVGDPTVSAFLATATANDVADTVLGPAVAYAAVAVDNSIQVDVGTEFYMGDVLCADYAGEGTCASTEEKMLLVSCTETAASGDGSNGLLCAGGGTTTVTVVRGYMNSLAGFDDDATTTDADSVVVTGEYMRAPSSLVWQDDGADAISSAVQERFGAYLVDSVTGGTLVF